MGEEEGRLEAMSAHFRHSPRVSFEVCWEIDLFDLVKPGRLPFPSLAFPLP